MRAFLLTLILALPAPALSQAQRLPTITPEGPPLSVVGREGFDRQWQAVGRLDTGTGFCTATLIAADLVLTAAHCLFDDSNNLMPLAPMRFNAGLNEGRSVAHRALRRAVVHPEYRPGGDAVESTRADLALLELDRAIPSGTVNPIPARGAAEVGETVQLVSYGRGRREHASLEDGCSVEAAQRGMQILSCHVDPGSSGSPVFQHNGGRLGIVSVISASAEWSDEPVSLAADLRHGLAPMLDLLERTDDVFSREAPRLRTIGGGNNGQEEIGARFIRVTP